MLKGSNRNVCVLFGVFSIEGITCYLFSCFSWAENRPPASLKKKIVVSCQGVCYL